METRENFINLDDKSDEFSLVYNQWLLAGPDQYGGSMRKKTTPALLTLQAA